MADCRLPFFLYNVPYTTTTIKRKKKKKRITERKKKRKNARRISLIGHFWSVGEETRPSILDSV